MRERLPVAQRGWLCQADPRTCIPPPLSPWKDGNPAAAGPDSLLKPYPHHNMSGTETLPHFSKTPYLKNIYHIENEISLLLNTIGQYFVMTVQIWLFYVHCRKAVMRWPLKILSNPYSSMILWSLCVQTVKKNARCVVMPFIEIVFWFRLLSQLIGLLHGQKRAYKAWISELAVTCDVDEGSIHFIFVSWNYFSVLGFFQLRVCGVHF